MTIPGVCLKAYATDADFGCAKMSMGGLARDERPRVAQWLGLAAAFGGLVFMNELVTLRLVISAILILGGVGLTLVRREKLSVPN